LAAGQENASAQRKVLPEEQHILEELKKIDSLYKAKHYAEALVGLEKALTMPEMKDYPEWRANAIYGIGCMHSLLGRKPQAIAALKQAIAAGYTDYGQYLSDTDLAPLRETPDFAAVLAKLRERNGIVPLVWEDRSEKTPAFPLMFEPAQAEQFVQMRAEFKMDETIPQVANELARLRQLASWTSRQWEHSSTQMASHADPLTILREAKQGGKFICMNYAVVLAGAAQAYGMPARVMALLPRDVEKRADSHSVVEVWLKQYHTWAIADAQNGIVPTVDGRPLSAIELQEALVRDQPVDCRTDAAACAKWAGWIVQYLYHFKIAREQRWYSRGQGNPQLVLLPKGAPHPKLYNGKASGVFANAVYTSNPDVFYAAP
jgi:tetratricopeptide (TPR) repeat protein